MPPGRRDGPRGDNRPMKNMTRNGTDGDNENWYDMRAFKDIYIPVTATVDVVILVTNMIILFIYTRLKKDLKRRIPNIMLMNQSVVDFIIGLSTIPRILCLKAEDCPAFLFALYKFFEEYTLFLAVFVLTVGSTERYICVKYPFIHRVHATKGKIKVVLLIMWLLAAIPGIIQDRLVYGINNQYYGIGKASLQLVMLIIAFSMLGATFRAIAASINKKMKKVKEETDVTNRVVDAGLVADQKKKAKITRVFLTMAIIYCLTVSPSIIASLLLDAIHINRLHSYLVRKPLFLFYITSSVINPFLTMACKSDFTDIIKGFLGKETKNGDAAATRKVKPK